MTSFLTWMLFTIPPVL